MRKRTYHFLSKRKWATSFKQYHKKSKTHWKKKSSSRGRSQRI